MATVGSTVAFSWIPNFLLLLFTPILCPRAIVSLTLVQQAVDLMQSCLTYDPARRPRLEDLRVHPWLDSEP